MSQAPGIQTHSAPEVTNQRSECSEIVFKIGDNALLSLKKDKTHDETGKGVVLIYPAQPHQLL